MAATRPPDLGIWGEAGCSPKTVGKRGRKGILSGRAPPCCEVSCVGGMAA